jgi:hypothetical protein
LLQELLNDYTYLDPQYVTSKLNNQKQFHIQQLHHIQPIPKPYQHIFHPHISMMTFNDEQQRVFDSIIGNPQGLHIFISTPNSGKTFFMKYITQHFQMHDKNMLLSMTISVATHCLSSTTTTMHTAFGIPTRGYIFVLLEPHNVIDKLKSRNVIIIDEMSIMTNNM